MERRRVWRVDGQAFLRQRIQRRAHSAHRGEDIGVRPGIRPRPVPRARRLNAHGAVRFGHGWPRSRTSAIFP